MGIFLIHYVGLAYSPFSVIGWASVLADSAGALLIAALIAEAWGLWRYFRGVRADVEPVLPPETVESRTHLAGGTVLILLGFLYGAWYAGFDLYEHEAREKTILSAMLKASTESGGDATQFVRAYGSLQAGRRWILQRTRM